MKKMMLAAVAAIFAVFVFAQDKKMSELKISDLPKGVSEYCEKNFGGKPVRAGKIEEKSTVTYVALVDMKGTKHAFLFDKDGKFTGKGDHLFNAKTQPVPTKAPVEAAPKK
jgi:hypothetical protein